MILSLNTDQCVAASAVAVAAACEPAGRRAVMPSPAAHERREWVWQEKVHGFTLFIKRERGHELFRAYLNPPDGGWQPVASGDAAPTLALAQARCFGMMNACLETYLLQSQARGRACRFTSYREIGLPPVITTL